MSVMMATFVALMTPRAAVCAERIVEVLDTEPSVAAPDAGHRWAERGGHPRAARRRVPLPRRRGAGAEHISFTSLAGQTTAIIGSTGAGKTTLVNLVARLFDVTEGPVLVDGVDVRDSSPSSCGSRIGLVPQRPYLFSGTVASNLRYGKPDATDDELWEALPSRPGRRLRRPMPGGLDARIAQGGTNVSGGQRQRLAIARALVRQPEIYLFDDSFSALDLATDARLRARLALDPAGATVLVVAQRVSTIARRRPDPGARGRPARRPRHARRAAGDLPDLRRDRRLADHAEEGGVSDARPATRPADARPARGHGDAAPGTGGAAAAAEPSSVRMGAGIPPRRRSDFRPRRWRLLRPAAEDRMPLVRGAGRRRRGALAVRAKSSATPPTSSSTASRSPRASTSPSCTGAARRWPVPRPRPALAYVQAYLLAGVVQRTMHRLRGRSRTSSTGCR